jgi:hypothetical protein
MREWHEGFCLLVGISLARNFMHKEGVVSEEALWARFASGEDQGQAF